MMKKLLLITLAVFQVSHSFAKEDTSEIIKDYKKYDRYLNNAYAALSVTLTPKDKELLRQSQLNWIKYRDSYCQFRFKIHNSAVQKYNELVGDICSTSGC